jgi:fumarate reductase flavoprotein subunit
MKTPRLLRKKTMTDLRKRQFMLAASAATAVIAVGPQLVTAQHAARDEFDLIVVGGGNAGLPTAIFAAQRGAKVAIVEAAGVLGGTLHLSSGQMSAAGTRLQKSRGIQDTPQSHFDDIMRISKNTADPSLVRMAVEEAAPAFDWLMANGFEPIATHPITGTTHEPYSEARYAWAKDGGRAILKVFNAQLAPLIESGRVVVLTAHSASELIQDRGSGAVRGVVVKDPNGQSVVLRSRHVALTSGGYTANPAMFEKYEGVKTHSRATYPFSQGIGIELGLSAGGYIRGGENHTPLFGAILSDDRSPTSIRAMARHFPPDRPPWEILVDAQGQRFLREDIPSHDAYEQALAALPNERCWYIFDEKILKQAPTLIRGGFSGPWTPADTERAFAEGEYGFHRAQNLASLAQRAGISASGLEATVAAYNQGVQQKRDPLGREHLPAIIGEAPYYAVEISSWNLLSYAGVAVDDRLRLIRPDGRVIPNLYAAGELLGMGSMMGKSLPGGMSVTPALSLGRKLGRELIDFGG